jgi:hypothetical protein
MIRKGGFFVETNKTQKEVPENALCLILYPSGLRDFRHIFFLFPEYSHMATLVMANLAICQIEQEAKFSG